MTTYFENDDWSKTVTPVRVLVCSAVTHGSQFGFDQVYSISGAVPEGAKKFARSHPILLPKFALACSRTR